MAGLLDNYLDLIDAAGELCIHPQSLRRLIKQKKVPATLFAGKYLIERDKLEMFKSNYDPRPRDCIMIVEPLLMRAKSSVCL